MPGKTSVKQTRPLHLLEFLGKPFLFLFTILTLFFLVYLHLLKIFTQRLFTLLKRFARALGNFHPLHPFLKNITLKPSKSFKILFTFSLFFLSYLFYNSVLHNLPNPHLLTTSLPSLSTKIYDRHGTLLYQIYRDENRTLIQLQDLPPAVINATLASEDSSFYSHPGISLSGIFRAAYNNLVNCRLSARNCTLQGGSTITQQLVKNALLTPERTLSRKLKEIILALWTETVYSKNEILELYFNYVPYGGTAYGIEEASQYYFGKSARQLNVAEAALLAGLPVAPTTFSPFGTHPYLAKSRQHQVLSRMVQNGYLSTAEALKWQEYPLSFHPRINSIRAPHFVMYVKDLLVQKFGEGVVHHGGLEVTTTLDLNLQTLLEKEINSELAHLHNLQVSNGAGLIIKPQTGEILAMVGSRDFFDSAHDGQVNLTLRPRQPGSAIKPITYTLAFLNGFTPASTIDDSPICFVNPGSPRYCPQNYDHSFHGRVTLRTALASSYNVPATKLLNGLGVNNLVKLAKKMGITTWNDSSRFGLSLTLGGGEVTLYDLASVYSVFANYGKLVPLRALSSVTDHRTFLSPSSVPPSREVIPPAIAYQIINILADNRARAPAFGFHSVLNLPNREVAVKTGTSNDFRDNWTIGFTQNYLVAVWVGNNDNSPMSHVASGITGASPIWNHTMRALLGNSPSLPFPLPANISRVNLSCTQTPLYEYFVKGTEPKPDCHPSPGTLLGHAAVATESAATE